jgi:Fe-S cluster assembly ATP-binding protein
VTERSIVETKDLVLDLGEKRILDHLSMQFWPGHVHAVVGPNGAGKSTLAHTIMGLSGYTEFEGDIVFEGESLKDLSIDQRARKGITLAWQEPARFEGLTVKRFIAAGARDASPESISRALELVGLESDQYLKRAVDRTLSGGERKRIELASILTMEPKLVFMDEPDSGIDVDALQRIFEAIQILKQKGTTVLLITHSATVLEKADHAFLICCGKLVEKGPVDIIMEYFGEKCIPCDHKNEPDLEPVDGER